MNAPKERYLLLCTIKHNYYLAIKTSKHRFCKISTNTTDTL